MISQSDLHHTHLFAGRYAATLRYLPTPGCHQWHGLRWQPIDLYIVTGMVNLRHWTLLLLTVLLPIVSSKMQIALTFKVINAKAVEGWWKVGERLVEGYEGLVEGAKWRSTRLSRHSQHILVEG